MEDNILKFFTLTMFVVGVCSKALMGFSPTVWASSYRTATFMVFITLALSLFYVKTLIGCIKKEQKDSKAL